MYRGSFVQHSYANREPRLAMLNLVAGSDPIQADDKTSLMEADIPSSIRTIRLSFYSKTETLSKATKRKNTRNPSLYDQMHGVLCKMRSRVKPHLNQSWRQYSLKHTHWSGGGYPKTSFRRPLVTPMPASHHFTLYASLAFSLHMQFHGFFLFPQPTLLHHLTRFSCFFTTWTHPNGSILHPHNLIQPHFALTQNTNQQQKQSCALSLPSLILFTQLMENCNFPLFPTTSTAPITTTMVANSNTNIGWSQNSDLSMFEPVSPQFHHPSPYQSLQFPYEQAPPMNPFSRERRIVDPYRTKLARINRKLARQRSLSLQRGASTQIDATRRLINSGANNIRQNNDTRRELYKFCTPDNKRLRVLTRKELKNSDVGSLGRIVLPKREAEVNLPVLYDKEGILLNIKDVYSNNEWSLKYKFWTNNKSRMYVLENTGDFVKQNRLGSGDSLTLYEDESKNLYFSITKVATDAVESSSSQQNHDTVNNNDDNNNNRHIYMPFTSQSREDEETSLQLLIGQQEPNDFLMTLPTDAEETRHLLSTNVDRYGPNRPVQMSSTSSRSSVDDNSVNFDDCYGGLDMLPDVYHYNFSI